MVNPIAEYDYNKHHSHYCFLYELRKDGVTIEAFKSACAVYPHVVKALYMLGMCFKMLTVTYSTSQKEDEKGIKM